VGGVLAERLAGWSPGPVEWTGTVSAWSMRAFADLLDQPDPLPATGPVVPPMWHWFGCLAHPAQSALGADGHPSAGHFLPPIPHRRRMFAGGRWTQRRPLPVDEPVDCRAELVSQRVKSGRSGELAFVTVRTEFGRDRRVDLVEEQDLVYRCEPGGPRRQPPGPEPGERPGEPPVRFVPDETALFRFSALTYNAHRIHYDQPYTTAVEGYPGLVVHGPLLALLALEVPRRLRPERRVTGFEFRLTRPAFAPRPLLAWAEPGGADEWRLRCAGEGAAPSLTGVARV
jgi:3-methylfumaryl-CoA hydratase